MLYSLILAQAATPSAPSSFLSGILPIVLMIAIFYFLVFMPMQRQKRQQAQMLKELQSGNEVLTSGGIVGTIVSITGDTLILRVKPDNVKLQIARSAVQSLVKPEGVEEKK